MQKTGAGGADQGDATLPASDLERWEDHAKAVHLPSLCILTLVGVGSCWYRGRRMCLPFLKLFF